MSNDDSDFLAFIHGELSKFECCCEPETHASTPPMMWPEWVACIRRAAILKEREACAALAEAKSFDGATIIRDAGIMQDIAAAIRARGKRGA